ncbi:hypothetical protein BHE74_00040939 [Ensete ventricosum]|nr:hypothetical protein GW17_00046419 [Ensete ventricosum]RWW52626.1 hypothetical protein BHE74_00040939 [Ensete ventricosum]RZS10801.1 hypothetical protein BHM03_00042068 [Ensete ventricosum]
MAGRRSSSCGSSAGAEEGWNGTRAADDNIKGRQAARVLSEPRRATRAGMAPEPPMTTQRSSSCHIVRFQNLFSMQ